MACPVGSWEAPRRPPGLPHLAPPQTPQRGGESWEVSVRGGIRTRAISVRVLARRGPWAASRESPARGRGLLGPSAPVKGVPVLPRTHYPSGPLGAFLGCYSECSDFLGASFGILPSLNHCCSSPGVLRVWGGWFPAGPCYFHALLFPLGSISPTRMPLPILTITLPWHRQKLLTLPSWSLL